MGGRGGDTGQSLTGRCWIVLMLPPGVLQDVQICIHAIEGGSHREAFECITSDVCTCQHPSGHTGPACPAVDCILGFYQGAGKLRAGLDARGQRIRQVIDVATSSGPATPTKTSVMAPTWITYASKVASERKRSRSKSGQPFRSNSSQRLSRSKRSRRSRLSSCNSISCGSEPERQDRHKAIFEERTLKATIRMRASITCPRIRESFTRGTPRPLRNCPDVAGVRWRGHNPKQDGRGQE
ncbi:hypothetical protein LSAT2_031892 [Lamellibrachia satsuma]|nr:hypothetical protein LSAT2_031892 [Lamellibrachia satsuma]